MYKLSIKRDFIARHFLIGGDWGPENQLHSHHYRVELVLEGPSLNVHNYLVDIVDLERKVDKLVDRYRDQNLNDLPEFSGQNPSIELFARLLCEALAAQIEATNLHALTTRLWENEIAWAAFRQEL